MKKVVLVLLIVFLIILGLVVVALISSDEFDIGKSSNSEVENEVVGAGEGVLPPTLDGENVGGAVSDGDSGSGSGSDGGGSSGGEAGSEDGDSGVSLPSDINTVECGFYFSEYGVCGGTCPSGTCGADGRSCYCQE